MPLNNLPPGADPLTDPAAARAPCTNPALLLNHRDGRLSARGAHDILNAIADAAHLQDDFTSHVLRHTCGTTLVRQGHDLVLVAELLSHARLETVRLRRVSGVSRSYP